MTAMRFTSVINGKWAATDFYEIKDGKMDVQSLGGIDTTKIYLTEEEIKKLRNYLSQQLRILKKQNIKK